ncbi:MAG: DUF4058 family protein [Blastocatellales bacterium]
MPLLDHFHPPLKGHRHWHSFHQAWATTIAFDLNRRLPDGWFAEPNVQFGIEVDVAAFDDAQKTIAATTAALSNWSPPTPAKSIPFTLVTDKVEVNVFDSTAGPVLAGAIELISPANKDRPASRDAFVSKCQTLLQDGIGLILVDIVTERSGNLHKELLSKLDDATDMECELYASAYRVVEKLGQITLDFWEEPLSVGSALPTMPLWLHGNLCLPVDLEATYQRTCLSIRIPTNGKGSD